MALSGEAADGIKLSGQSDASEPKVVSLSDTIKKRERFDTLEEMEILGQGEYGKGLNVPIISKGLDHQGLSAKELGQKKEKQKLL